MTSQRRSRLPAPVQLGWMLISFEQNDDALNEKDSGQFVFSKQKVVVSEGLKGRELVVVVTHELMHAIWLLAGLDVCDGLPTEEQVCSVFGHYLTELEIRNPKFVEWKERALEGC